jgi:[ribosomal protein S5]-alanine N-acetyltransferase
VHDKVFETQRLVCRFWRLEDARSIFELYRDPLMVRYLGLNSKTIDSLEEAEEWTRKRVEAQKDWKPGKGFWAVERKEDQRLIGAIICKPIPDGSGVLTDDIEIGWHLGVPYWGNGFATEAALAVVRFGFESDSSLTSVVAVCNHENIRSERVMQRIGMIKQPDTDRYYGQKLVFYKLQRLSNM